MEKNRNCLFIIMFAFFFFFFFVDSTTRIPLHRLLQTNESSISALHLNVSPDTVEIDNGIVKLRLINPTGQISGVSYNGIENILEPEFKESQRGYWDIVWKRREMGKSFTDPLKCSSLKIVSQSKDQIEVSFTMKWNSSAGVPLNVDKRYIMLRGVSGFYAYAIFEHLKGWPALNIDRARLAFKLDKNKFRYMAISDDMQRIMPTAADRESGKVLAYKEAVLLTNPTDPKLKGEVDDKYQYSIENKDSHLHGWISSNPHVGFWVITPSDEFRSSGPVKPDLASHTGPVSLSIFFSNHYAGPSFGVLLKNGEQWKKVYGPIFIYLNSDQGNETSSLWQNAKKQMLAETEKWPYDFPMSADFPHPNQRGSVHGRLLVHDEYIDSKPKAARSAYVVLAPPGDAGSWQDNFKGYQFWTRTDENGSFTIRGVRADTYNLYAWVPGIVGDFKLDHDIIIKPGSEIQIGDLVYNPPRNGPTLWEIGIPDRTASEFYVPDPDPGLINKLTTQKFRQYGLWDRYTDLYPKRDLIYTVGVSNYRKDWFFAHVTRKAENKTYEPTTWQISFSLRNVSKGDYTLRIALAAAHSADLQVWMNNPNTSKPHFTTGKIGRENAIARHGIHGRYWLYNVNVSESQFWKGSNTVYIKQATAGSPFTGVMYDYIRLEAPSQKHDHVLSYDYQAQTVHGDQ